AASANLGRSSLAGAKGITTQSSVRSLVHRTKCFGRVATSLASQSPRREVGGASGAVSPPSCFKSEAEQRRKIKGMSSNGVARIAIHTLHLATWQPNARTALQANRRTTFCSDASRIVGGLAVVI